MYREYFAGCGTLLLCSAALSTFVVPLLAGGSGPAVYDHAVAIVWALYALAFWMFSVALLGDLGAYVVFTISASAMLFGAIYPFGGWLAGGFGIVLNVAGFYVVWKKFSPRRNRISLPPEYWKRRH
jgi:cell division protein FtsW (lipid II flippase)